VRLRVYLAGVLTFGAIVLALSVRDAVGTASLGWLVFAALAIVTSSFKLDFASVSATISVSDTFFITTALLFGPGPAALAIALDSLVFSCRKGDSWVRMGFNVAAPAISLWAGAQVCFALAGVGPLEIGSTHTAVGALAVPLIALTLVYFLLNSGMTAMAVALDSRQAPFLVWTRHFMWVSVGYLGAASAAFCLILLMQQVSMVAAIMVLPLLAVFHLTLRSSFGRLNDARRHLGDLDRLYLSTIETLAMAIDAKDDVTHSHVRRVQAYAVGLAAALGIDDDLSVKALKAAALLHDTGKLAVPEHILNKPGKLTPSEFEKMKLHVDVGADILSLVEFPYPVVPIVRCHHENWDGSGYPRGVKGEAIPIGARILSVVDCFDALTSDRPYRRRMTDEDALQILRDRSGTMYDPHVVDTFIAVYKTIEVEPDAPEQRDVMRRIVASSAETPDVVPAPAPHTAASEVLAFVSLARLASGEGSVADILALSSNLIATVVPSATGAWYLLEGGTRLNMTAAFGPGARILDGMTMTVGQRLSGWVAASRQPVVNSDAALDLEGLEQRVSPPLRSCLSVPLLTGETLVGVLTLYSDNSELFDDTRCRMLEMVAPHIASAVQLAASRPAPGREPVPEKSTGTNGRDLRLVSARNHARTKVQGPSTDRGPSARTKPQGRSTKD